MRWRPLALMATVGLVVAFWASPAMAKGPDQLTITGPGLDNPIVVTGYGEPGSGGSLGEMADGSGLFLVMFEPSDHRVVDDAPAGALGPKFELSYRVPDGTSTGSTVRQDLYPLASGGPVTYTESGQAVFGSTTVGGWYRTPASFNGLLEQLGLPTAPIGQSPPEPPAGAEPANPTSPTAAWLPIAVAVLVAVVVFAGVLFGRRANPARRVVRSQE